MQLIPPKGEPIDAWPRGGIKGMLWAIFVGVLLSAAAFWLTESYWWLISVPVLAWVGFTVRLRPGGSMPRTLKPPNVLW